MGDRGNVKIIDQFDPSKHVHLYTHWRGSELKDIVQAAMRKRWRWNDSGYLARIIFCEMVKGDEAGETGFGINADQCDEGPLIIVNVPEQTVTLGRKAWSFEDFVK